MLCTQSMCVRERTLRGVVANVNRWRRLRAETKLFVFSSDDVSDSFARGWVKLYDQLPRFQTLYNGPFIDEANPYNPRCHS